MSVIGTRITSTTTGQLQNSLKTMLFLLVFTACLTLISGTTEGQNNTIGKERIIGGKNANIQEFPHLVSLQYFRQHICGGSIISEKHILTAAHCTIGIVSQFLTVLKGSTYLKNENRGIGVTKIIQHPKFSYTKADYDVSVLVLRKALRFDEFVHSISLGSKLPDPGTLAIAAGWGVTKSNGKLSSTLRSVQIPIIDQEKCREAYKGVRRAFPVTDRMICAGFEEGGKNICSGDSGSSLTIDDKIYGISSWSVGCALPNRPGVFTSVVAVEDFINSAMADV